VCRRLVFLVPLFYLLVLSLAYAGFDDGKAAYDRGDYVKAYKEFKPLAEEGNAEAQYFVGFMYDTGEGVAKDKDEAAKWYRKAAEQGHLEAQLRMLTCYLVHEKDIDWLRKSAEEGDAIAQCLLGTAFAKGQGVPQDHAEAAKWYRMSADQGNDNSQFSLGWMYAYGQGVPQDFVLAHMWFTLAAAQGNSEAQKGRDTVARCMTRSQIAEAQRLARECKPKGKD